MTSQQTGIISQFDIQKQTGLITSDLGSDILFSFDQVADKTPVYSGGMVTFTMDESTPELRALQIRLI